MNASESSVLVELIKGLASPEYLIMVLVLLGVGYLLWKIGGKAITVIVQNLDKMSNAMEKISADISELKTNFIQSQADLELLKKDFTYLKEDVKELKGKRE